MLLLATDYFSCLSFCLARHCLPTESCSGGNPLYLQKATNIFYSRALLFCCASLGLQSPGGATPLPGVTEREETGGEKFQHKQLVPEGLFA